MMTFGNVIIQFGLCWGTMKKLYKLWKAAWNCLQRGTKNILALPSKLNSKRKLVKASHRGSLSLPPTDSDWHTSYNHREMFDKPDRLVISLDISKNEFDPHWDTQVYEILYNLSETFHNGEDIPTVLIHPETGEHLGEIVIISKKICKVANLSLKELLKSQADLDDNCK